MIISDVMLLALMLGEGAVWPLKAVGKGRGWVVPWSLQIGASPTTPMSDLGPPEPQRRFKPPSLWEFATAAVGREDM